MRLKRVAPERSNGIKRDTCHLAAFTGDDRHIATAQRDDERGRETSSLFVAD
jgi:hypothetical protein